MAEAAFIWLLLAGLMLTHGFAPLRTPPPSWSEVVGQSRDVRFPSDTLGRNFNENMNDGTRDPYMLRTATSARHYGTTVMSNADMCAR